jgi:hypothetical protein
MVHGGEYTEARRVSHLGSHAGPIRRFIGCSERLVRSILVNQRPTLSTIAYCGFAYSALARFRMGMPGSPSFQSVRKSL